MDLNTKYQNGMLFGDSREKLKEVPDETVQMCVTSPPYFGLRDYGTGKWVGGNPNCNHVKSEIRTGLNLADSGASTRGGAKKIANVPSIQYTHKCEKCGAVREDAQIGLEASVDEYMSNLVEVFREVRRVLKPDGTLWLNIGDSYCGSGKGGQSEGKKSVGWRPDYPKNHFIPNGLKSKDLIGIPWRLAFALQAEGWYLRSDIIWNKNNPMPESVKDRPTKPHEYIFLLSKNRKYFYDYEAIKEAATSYDTHVRDRDRSKLNNTPGRTRMGGLTRNNYKTKNKRSVWDIALKPYKGSHFAVFPPELPITCIKAGSRVGDIVLDPFMGSGTTAEVALRLGRFFLGVDLDVRNEVLINKRIKPLLSDMFLTNSEDQKDVA